jgi:nucleoside-diphosphate-sugar epimerase
MKVFIAGASGAIGRPLVQKLLDGGHEVVGMTRSNANALSALGAEPVVADAFDAAAVRRAVERAAPDVVVNELTDLNKPLNPRKYDEWLEGTNRLRTEGTKNLVDAAAAAGATKFVSQSVAFFYDLTPGVKTEDSATLDPATNAASAALSEHDRLVLGAPGGIVLRYGFFYGPGTSLAKDGVQMQSIRKRQLPIIGDGSGTWPFIHVDDAASATVAAIERGEPGVYNIVDNEPAAMRDWVPYVADLMGAKKPWRAPVFIAKFVAGPMVGFATQLQPVSNAKAKQQLGWQPTYGSWRDGFRAELG